MQSPSTSSSTNTTKSSTKKMLNPSKTSSIKTKSTTVLNLANPTTTSKDLETSLEIEKISKKISEHADALYRTWKSHGLAPTEILELYAVEAGVPGVAAGAIADDKNTEDLQKLVNSFVNKDKEQRGVKTLNNKTKNITSKQEMQTATPKVIEHKIQKLAMPSSTQNLQGNVILEPLQPVTTTKKSSTPLKSTNFLLKNATSIDLPDSPAAKITKLKTAKQGIGGGAFKNDHTNVINASAMKSQTSKPLDIEIDFNINLDLNLDVHKLTQQQTNNLHKIKELLKDSNKTAATQAAAAAAATTSNTTKIPSVVLEKTAGKTKDVKLKKSSIENSPKITGLEENKQNDERKLVDTQTTRKIGNKLKSTEEMATIRAHDLKMQQNQSIETLKKSKCLDNPTTIASTQQQQTNKKRTLLTAGSSSSSTISNTNIGAAITNGNVTIDKALLNAEHFDNLAHNKENSIKVQKSTTKAAKTSKFKEKTDKTLKESKETPQAKILDSKESAGHFPIITSALMQTASPVNVGAAELVTESQNMETPQHSDSSNIMPTPTKLKSTRPLSNGQEKSLRSPFLTRGSVAERVMIFEKCPDVRNSFLNIKRPDKTEAAPKTLLKVKLHSTPPPPPEQNSLQREIRNTKSVYIPRFYFPHGKPQPTIALERTLRGILSAFDTFPNNQVTKDELPRILKICGLPFYWRMPVMVFCQQGNSGLVERQRFVDFWKQMNVYCHDDASRFVYILSRGQRIRTFIMPEDLAPLVQDVVDTHPGLAFLKEATEFHSRYVHTVIARIFYSVNRSWSGRISISELKKSDLLEILTLLEEEDDINQIMAFFSYEHFYVIYCKFWELDKDHDLLISQDDLARHSDHALSTRIVERIFSGCVTRSDNKKNPDDEPKMSYTDFVWFLLSEEDKRTSTAIEYWFRCMDIDGDGQLSMYELEYFYEEQQQRMESIGIESLPFEDCLCQMLDMIKPRRRDAITLSDLKNCKMTHVFFDTFFNLEKYLDHEQRDPFASQRDEYASDWERFAAQEYELLITEENE